MFTVLHILVDIILPVFALIGVGVLVDRAFKLDLTTLSRLNFYVFVPALVFVRLLDSRLDGELIGLVILFNLVHMALLFALCWPIFGRGEWRRDRPLLIAAALFNNSGNYGIPFAQLAFGDLGVQVMALVLVFQNVISFTLGLWLFGDERACWKARLLDLLKAPVLYAVGVALLLNVLHIKLPEPIYFPLGQLANGLVPVALLTLGVQLSRVRLGGKVGALTAASAVRLIVAPLLAFGLAWVWPGDLDGQAGQVFPVLICAAALPVAVNVYILAMEYGRRPELASLIVFWSTIVSAITLTVWLVVLPYFQHF